jgi:hypothetical protein
MTPEDIRLLSQITGALPPKNAKRLNEVPFPMGDPRMEEERQRLAREYQAGRAAQRKTFRDAPIEEQIKAIGNTAGFFGGAVLEGLAEPFAKLGGGTAEGSLTDYFTPKTPAQSAALGESAEALYPVAQAFEAAKIPDITPGMLTSPTRLIDDATRQAASAAKRGVMAAGRAASSTEDMLRQKLGAPVGSIQLTQSQPTQNPLGFYSALDRAADSLQNKGTGQQFLNQLTNMQGVKGDEIKWTGLDEFLKGKKDVTKQEVKDYLNANQVKIEEVRLGEMSPEQTAALAQAKNRYREITDLVADTRQKVEEGVLSSQEGRAILEPLSAERSRLDNQILTGGATPTKFRSYSTRGGKNYRELLLTLPEKAVAKPTPMYTKGADILAKQALFVDGGFSAEAVQAAASFLDEGGSISRATAIQDAKVARGYGYTPAEKEAGQILRAISGGARRAEAEAISESSKLNYRSPHFDQPNILAHMRVSDFEQDGKKIMLVDEVQSDWHQEGRKKGYKTDAKAELPEGTKVYGPVAFLPGGRPQFAVQLPEKVHGRDLFSGDTREEAIANAQSFIAQPSLGAVPDAPFKTTWHELALRRAVREASEKGFDKIAIPTGSVQNDRYKLSNFVNAIDYRKNDDGTYGLIALDDKGNSVVTKNRLTESELEDTIGKEMAKKIVNGVGESFPEGSTAAREGYKKISGIDLEVGGEGMKGFYDQMVPKYLNKLGSKFGTKVTRGTIKDANGKDVPVHELTITPQMRKSVLEQGQPLFAAVPAVGLTQEEEGYAAGGAIKKAAKAAKEAAKVDVESQAPMVLVPSKISDLKEAIRQSKGNYGAKRVERAADEIKNLEALFQEQALREAFGGDNAKALMTMNPKDFEKFAEPIDVRFINPTSSRYTSTGEIVPYSEYMESYLPGVGAFESIPFLEINKKQQGKKQLPFISGHEGRHRSRVMSNKGEQASLVQLFPRYNLREPFPRRSQEEYIEALKKELGLTGNLVEPEIIFDSFQQGEIKRPAIPLPDIYANGGVVKKAGGGAIKKAAKAAKAASKASETKEQPIYWGMYRGYAGDDVSATEPQFAAMDKKVAEYYAKKRAAQTGLPPHLEMIYKQLEAGRKYGHTVPMDEHNRELLITQAYELQPEDIIGRYQLKKRGGLASLERK